MKDKILVLLLLVLTMALTGCTDDTSGLGLRTSPPDTETGMLMLDGSPHDVTMTAQWKVYESPECAPQFGNIRLVLAGQLDSGEDFQVVVSINFDGLELPSMPLEVHNYSFDCPRNDENRKSSISLWAGSNGAAQQFISNAGTLNLITNRNGDRVMFNGQFEGVVLVDEDSGESITLSGTFEEEGGFLDHTDDKRFSE